MSEKCLLCHSVDLQKLEITAKPAGCYWACGHCDYIFREPSERLSAQLEKKRYELHENVESPGYRKFLMPVVEMVLGHFSNLSENFQTEPGLSPLAGLCGLDYGCGPSFFLSCLLHEKNVKQLNYDPLFFPDKKVFKRTYDFVTSTETFEHMFDPRQALNRIVTILKVQGLLIVMTSAPPDLELFKSWSYRRDETHIGFFSRKSFSYIATEWGLEILEAHSNIWLLRKR